MPNTTPEPTLAVDFWDAVAIRIDAATTPPSALGTPRFYRGAVVGAPPPGYFLLGASPETPDGYYNGQAGVSGRFTIHCWADTVDNANRLYRWLKAVLLGDPPTVPGVVITELQIEKRPELPDPSGTAWQVPMTVNVEAIAA